MDAKTIEKAKEKFCDEIESAVKKGSMSSGDFETLYKAVIGYEKALKIEEMDDMDGHSQRGGNWDARGSYAPYRRSYDGNAYDGEGRSEYSGARRGMHYVRGHYSRDDGMEMVREKIADHMGQVSGNERMILEKALDILG